MQLTIDVDKHFIENLKKEFHTHNVKDAINQLFDFYRQTIKIDTINTNDNDYGFIEDAKIRRKNGEKTYSIGSVISEYQ